MVFQQAVGNLLNKVNRVSENCDFVISVFWDLTKAFDLVNRSYLLLKLFLYRTQDIENDWIESCLTSKFNLLKMVIVAHLYYL